MRVVLVVARINYGGHCRIVSTADASVATVTMGVLVETTVVLIAAAAMIGVCV